MGKVILNIYGETTTSVDNFYKLNETEYKVAMFMLSIILDIKATIDSEDGTLTLRFEHDKYWCEVDGYSKEKYETINNTLNGGIVMHFGEHINTISYYGNRVMLYIVGSMYVEVFYDPNQNKIMQIQKLDPTHPRLALYTKDIDIGDLNT